MAGGFLGSISGQVRLDIRQAVAAYATVRAQNAKTVYALRGTGDAFIASGKTMLAAGGIMAYGIYKAVNAAADFERKMDFFSAVTDTNADKMKKLSDFTLQLAEDTIYSADQIADGIIELGKAGVDAEDIMKGIGKAMTNLGAAGDIPLAESGQIITSTVAQFDKDATDAVRITDLLAGAANASIADITDIGVSLKYVGGVANAAGVNLEDTITAISLLAKAGIRGSTAGTSLRQMLVSFGGATKPARDVLEDLGILTYDLAGANETLAKVTGGKAKNSVAAIEKELSKYIDSIGEGSVGTQKNADAVKDLMLKYGGLRNLFYDSEGNLKSLSKVFQILQDKTKGLTAQQRLQALRTIFNNRALSAAAILTRDGAKGFKDMNKEMSKTTAAAVATERLDNLSGDIEILKGNIQTLLIRAGGPLQKQLRGWVQGLTKAIQAWDNLSPAMQTSIVKGIAFASAALIAMGAINIVIGVILKFIAHMLKMAAGVKFLYNSIKGLRLLFAGPLYASIAAIAGPILLVIGIIAALVIAFIIAYKKIKPFREWVNRLAESFKNDFLKPLWGAIKAVYKFLKALDGDKLKEYWQKLKDGAANAFHAVIDWFKRLPGVIARFLKKIISGVGRWGAGLIASFVTWLTNLYDTVTTWLGKVQDLFTLRNLGFAVGYALGLVVRIFIKFFIFLYQRAKAGVQGLIGFFRELGPKIIPFFVRLVQRALSLLGKLKDKAIRFATQLVLGIIDWFKKLPGRTVAFAVSMYHQVVGWLSKMVSQGTTKAKNMFTGMIEWFQKLPGRATRFFVQLVAKAARFIGSLPGKMVDWANQSITAFMNILSSLPGLAGDILDKVIQAFKDVIQKGYNAAKDFAGGLWDGFKKGLGIESPSFIEKAMFALNDNMHKETGKLARQTANIQKLGKRFTSTNFEANLGTPSLRNFRTPSGVQDRMTVISRERATPSAPVVVKAKVNKKTDVTVNNPRAERAGKSVAKAVRDSADDEGWF